jgi:hypothetical protein
MRGRSQADDTIIEETGISDPHEQRHEGGCRLQRGQRLQGVGMPDRDDLGVCQRLCCDELRNRRFQRCRIVATFCIEPLRFGKRPSARSRLQHAPFH